MPKKLLRNSQNEDAAFKGEQKLEKWQLIPEEGMAAMGKEFDYAAAWNAPGEAASIAAGMKSFVEKLDDHYDNGPHFPITPEGKRLVDAAIVKVLSVHMDK